MPEPPATTAEAALDPAPPLRVGLVNNMPDAALRRTEGHFTELLREAHGGAVTLVPTSLPEVPRSDWGRRYVAALYTPLAELLAEPPDALIVTGAEPRTRELADEPNWRASTALFDWIADHAVPTAFSCLAAHAAVLYWDGIRRQPLERKCFGAFAHRTCAHELTRNAAPAHVLPHSRWNDVPEVALRAGGYTILTRSDEVGVGAFTRDGARTDLFFQGHPEYDGGTLLREYRRDVRRFVMNERETYPDMPRHYLSESERQAFSLFETRARLDRNEAIMPSFPDLAAELRDRPWLGAGAAIFRAWLARVRGARPASVPAPASALRAAG